MEEADKVEVAPDVTADICRAFDGAAAGKSKAAFSDWQVGLP